MSTEANQVADALGVGMRQLAEICGVARTVPYGWKRIPDRYRRAIVEEARSRQVALPAEFIFECQRIAVDPRVLASNSIEAA